MSILSRCLLTAAGGLLLLPGAGAAVKPTVQVVFSVEEPIYLGSLQQRSLLEKEVKDFLIETVGDQIGFLTIIPSRGQYTLTYRLGRPGASKTFPHQVDFSVELRGDGGVHETSWVFRELGAWGTGIGNWKQFATEIEGQLAKMRSDSLVRDLLSWIPIATEGDLVKDLIPGFIELAWIVPFTQQDLCMSLDSALKLTAEVRSRAGTLASETKAVARMVHGMTGPQQKFWNRLVCALDSGQRDFNLLRQSGPGEVHVQQVFVVDYRRIPAGCKPPQTPSAVAPAFGGGNP